VFVNLIFYRLCYHRMTMAECGNGDAGNQVNKPVSARGVIVNPFSPLNLKQEWIPGGLSHVL